MVYYKDTLQPLHQLTLAGQETYETILAVKADEILFKHKHPIKYWWQRLMNLLRKGDSEWIGIEYDEQEKYKDGFSYSHQISA